tara:strand:+ start:432 stop:1766 length:1335 start_codon:yes stop_codon:yes gene_type:complete
MKILSPTEINKIKPSTRTRTYNLSRGTGVSLVVEKLPIQCKRIVGVTQYPRGRKGKNIQIPLGVWGKDISTRDDLLKVLRKWMELKFWCKTTGNHPKYFGKENTKEIEMTLIEVVDDWMENIHKKKVKKRSWETSQGRLNQILNFWGKDRPLSDFEIRNNGRQRVVEMHSHIKQGTRYGKPAIVHASKCRKLIKQVFEYAIDRGWMDEFQNPASKKLMDEGLGHIKKGHPYLKWDEVPKFLEDIERNDCNSYVLTRLCTKLYLLTSIRVGAIVSMEWDWYDPKTDMLVIPPETSGLKRKRDQGDPHYIPCTLEIHKILTQLRLINGKEKYVFRSPEGKKYPHINPETINNHFRLLGYLGKQDAHGWRDVVVTSGVDIGGFDIDVIERQIGHKNHKRGAIGSYDNSEKLEERIKFIEWWNKELVKRGLKLIEKEFDTSNKDVVYE